jgi:glyoxylase-like metal-dependent hydrolase (beta-lactamase superfamily II)
MTMTRTVALACKLGAAAALAASVFTATAQETPQYKGAPKLELKQVAPDLQFLFDFASSNASFLVTDEGVLVVDTRQHVRDGEDLIARIRKVTDKPIKWVVNSHFHADHYLGNAAFKAVGATIVAHQDTAMLMQKMHAKEVSRRGGFFKKRGYDPKDTALVMPDATFHNEMTIRLGGRAIHLYYLGAGQQIGDTFVHIPHNRTVITPGAFARQSWANTVFTPSVETWIGVLKEVRSMDPVDIVLPAHGDVANKNDVADLQKFLEAIHGAVKAGIAQGMSVDEIVKANPFEQYSHWRNYDRRAHTIQALHELLTKGTPAYFR